MVGSIGVIGLGRFGSSLAKTLYKIGHRVLALDTNEANVENIKNVVTWARKVDYSLDCFKESGIVDCDTVVVAIGHDIQENIMVTLMMKELNVKKVISRSISDMHAIVLNKIGADRVINPEAAMGVRLANQIVSSDILEMIEISPEYSIHQIRASKKMIGRNLADLKLREKYGAIVIAIKRESSLNVIPGATEVIGKGDVIITIIRTANLNKLIHIT